jgi:hypothetical protein
MEKNPTQQAVQSRFRDVRQIHEDKFTTKF